MKKGIILSGEYKSWNIDFINNVNGDTGGFYIYFYNSVTNEGYNCWFEKYDEAINQLSDFKIKWLE